MNEAGTSLPTGIGTLVEGIAATVEATERNPDAFSSVRRMAGVVARLAADAGLEQLAERARGLAGAHPDNLLDATQEFVSFCAGWQAEARNTIRHILVVDDDPVSVALVEAVVSSADRQLHAAGSAAEARAILAERLVDLVLLDLRLPDADGRDLLVEVRSDSATMNTPVIVLSGAEGAIPPAECYALGADAFLTKPPDLPLLRSTVTRQLARLAERGRPAGGEESPRSDTEASPHPISPSEPPIFVQKRVLLVEDDDIAALLVEHRLGKEGIAVERHDDGRKGLDAALSSSFDLVILDVKLPGLDGFEFLRRLRDAPPARALPVIILSGLDDETDVVRGLDLGADDYLAKPFSPAELMARVRRLIGT
jgi:DNA-binding response OmpR family regulator